MRTMDEEAKQLLREIRDLMAASPERYERAIEANRKLYAEHMAKSKRLAVVFLVMMIACVALSLINR